VAVDPIRADGDPQLRVAVVRTHELFEQHAGMVYGLCRALLRDPDHADDATQATFISAYRSLLGGNRVRDPAPWLATIARNECLTRSRARMREPLPLQDADLGHVHGPEAELERKAVVSELQQAIAELPEKQREAVVLRDLYGMPYTEVGAALGISVASVESLLFRARRTLRVSLKPLASGALTVPVAVREGIAQALPALGGAGAAGGGATSGAAGLGLLAKLAGGPTAVKAAAGLAAAVAAGSIAVAGVEHATTQRHHHPQAPVQPQAVAVRSHPGAPSAPATAFVGMTSQPSSGSGSGSVTAGSGHGGGTAAGATWGTGTGTQPRFGDAGSETGVPRGAQTPGTARPDGKGDGAGGAGTTAGSGKGDPGDDSRGSSDGAAAAGTGQAATKGGFVGIESTRSGPAASDGTDQSDAAGTSETGDGGDSGVPSDTSVPGGTGHGDSGQGDAGDPGSSEPGFGDSGGQDPHGGDAAATAPPA